MFKDVFPVKLIFKPAETFSALAAGEIGWGWPLALSGASAAASAFTLCSLPPEFLAEVTSGVKLAPGRGFLWYLSVGLPGGLGFTLFFCVLLAAFLPYIKAGRLPVRLALLMLGTGAYGFFFLLPFKTAAYTLAARLLAALAAAFAIRTAAVSRLFCARLAKAVLALSILTLAADAVGAAAALAGSVIAYNAGQYFFAALALAYTVKAAAAFSGASAARAAAAVVPAMLAAAAFLFSLSALGLLSPEIFQTLLLI